MTERHGKKRSTELWSFISVHNITEVIDHLEGESCQQRFFLTEELLEGWSIYTD